MGNGAVVVVGIGEARMVGWLAVRSRGVQARCRSGVGCSGNHVEAACGMCRASAWTAG